MHGSRKLYLENTDIILSKCDSSFFSASSMYTYLLINIFSILIPLLFSFEKRLSFYKLWKALFPAVLITGSFFIVWDHYMTLWNVWQFNPAYVLGINVWGLPIEEWLFFLTIPYSCLFIYESLNFLIKKDHLLRFSKTFPSF